MNVNFHISRYTALLIILALLFSIIVIKAFSYLPEMQNDTFLLQNAKNKVLDADTEEEPVITDENKSEAGEIIVERIDELEDSNSNTYDSDSEISKLLNEAENLRLNKEYSKALSIYMDVVNRAEAPKDYALCYDGISKIYTIRGNYEKALAKAQLAYKYEPTDVRKLAIAKLYHKIGDTENEKALINELLSDIE